ncbi:hypothetical protein [Bacillus sp. KH172YL63]|uniref:hypothetical protein n=1 Tax=Bacillus sp. KH172YL63 TaxID=2709784 RepID=UPI0013E5166E|nr:hypothetical protein [Bacillus sp. KH172YL63]BCB05130.1 hypothetical protein KH172YL63_32630 [Bacillus sp. KH172YL63]
MLGKIKGVKLLAEYKNPVYKVKVECPDGSILLIKFDYTYVNESYMPMEVYHDGVHKGARLAWYTNKIEKMTVQAFLEGIATKINKKYKFDLKEKEFRG